MRASISGLKNGAEDRKRTRKVTHYRDRNPVRKREPWVVVFSTGSGVSLCEPSAGQEPALGMLPPRNQCLPGVPLCAVNYVVRVHHHGEGDTMIRVEVDVDTAFTSSACSCGMQRIAVLIILQRSGCRSSYVDPLAGVVMLTAAPGGLV